VLKVESARPNSLGRCRLVRTKGLEGSFQGRRMRYYTETKLSLRYFGLLNIQDGAATASSPSQKKNARPWQISFRSRRGTQRRSSSSEGTLSSETLEDVLR
jgi:hypothetical protein